MIRIYWQVFHASGIVECESLRAAAVWAEDLLARCPGATVVRQP
jgi:hypothetical protein